jgi:hypothetical protein
MLSLTSTRLRLAGSLVTAGLLAAAATPSFAQSVSTARCDAPVLDLANPSPGDMLMPGGYEIQGVAFDPRAQQDAGIDRVSVFLDSRDAGGIDLGNVTPGLSNAALETSGLAGPDSFNLIVTLPNVVGAHNLVAYARSSTTGQETAVSVPIVLGEDPTKAGLVVGASTESNTNPGASPTNCTTTTTTTAPAAPAVVAPAPAPAPTTLPALLPAATPHPITLQLGNPQPGDTVIAGGYIVSGSAVDARAQSGSGIDRVSVFLDSRDDGGLQLTQLVPTSSNFTVNVTLPTNRIGGHTLVVYAHSSVSDTETMVAVPIVVDH